MKKILACVLSVLLVISAVPLIGMAADGTGDYVLENVPESVEIGDEFEVDIAIANNPGMISLRFRIYYDMDVLELVSVTDSQLLNGWTTPSPTIKSPYILRWADSLSTENHFDNGTVATLKFKALSASDSTEIEIEHIESRTWDGDRVTFNGTTDTLTVTAPPVAATGVSLNTETLSLMTGDSETLVANVEPADATNKVVTWESSDTSVATVDENGKVTAVKEGSATITVRTADGGFTDTCTVTVDCSHLSTTVVPAEPSTCIEHGHAEYTVCNDCGAVVAGSDAELPLAPHNYVENAEEEYLVSAATCVDRAVYYESCSVCGAAGTETFEYGDVDLTNHVGETYLVGQKDATCIETGYTGDVYCSSCDNMISAGTETPLAEHTYGEWVETTKPTCTEPGEETRVCEVCGADETRPVDATGHTPGEWTEVTAPTCTDEGLEEQRCTVCGDQIATRPIEATGHTPGEWTEVTAPTCTEDGLEEQRCTVCGDQIATRAIPATGHTLGEWTTTIEPTCTEDGEREAFCEECGVRFTEPVPATGHTAGEWEITTPATCTEDGVRTTTCTVCGVEYTEVIPATGHQYGAWTVVKEATETEEGLRERVCSVCGEKESEVIPKLAAEETETTETTTSSTNGSTSSNTDTKSPKTGLETGLVIFAVIGAAATVVVVLTISRKKKSLNK